MPIMCHPHVMCHWSSQALLGGRTQVREGAEPSREQHLGGLRGQTGSQGATQPGTNCDFSAQPFPCLGDAHWLWAQLGGDE